MQKDEAMSITVRAARPDDLERIARFNRAMARETEGRELEPSVVRAGVETLLAEPDRGRYWIAERGGEAAGQALVTPEWSDWRNAEVWWIQSVYVAPDHRRTGVYRALHRHVRDRARREGAAGLRLYVDRDNRAARAVYRTMGMEEARYVMYEEMWRRAGGG